MKTVSFKSSAFIQLIAAAMLVFATALDSPTAKAQTGQASTPPKTNPQPVESSKPIVVESEPNPGSASQFVLSEDEMRKFEGKYETENQKLKLSVYIAGGKLLLAISDSGQSPVVLIPTGQTRFQIQIGVRGPPIVVHFEMNKSLLKNSNNQRVERMVIENLENEKIVLLPKRSTKD